MLALRPIPTLALLLALAPTLAAQDPSKVFDLEDRDLIVELDGGAWQLVTVRAGLEHLILDLVPRTRRGQRPPPLNAASLPRLVGLERGDEAITFEAEASRFGADRSELVFAAPRSLYSALQLELADGRGDVVRLPFSLPGASRAREAFATAEEAVAAEEHRRAALAYREVVAERPSHVASWRGLGRTLVRLRQNEEATTVLERVLVLEPNSSYDHALAGFAILDVKSDAASAARALEHLETARRLGYAWEELDYFFGRAHELMGDVTRARTAYQSCASLCRSDGHREQALAFLAATATPAPPPVVAPVPEPKETQPVESAPVVTEPVAEPVAPSASDPAPLAQGGEEESPAPLGLAPPAALVDHIGYPLSGVADWGRERAELVNIWLGRETWIVRIRPEGGHVPGEGTHLADNLGGSRPLLDSDPVADVYDLTFSVPGGRARTVTLNLVDAETGETGDRTFEVPGYEEFRDAMREGNRALADGDSATAERFYAQAILYRAGDEAPWWRHGVCRMRAGDLEGASRDLERALILAPESADILTDHGAVLLARGDHARARDRLVAAKDLGASTPQLWLDLGAAHAALGEIALARAAYETILERYPGGSAAESARERIAALGE